MRAACMARNVGKRLLDDPKQSRCVRLSQPNARGIQIEFKCNAGTLGEAFEQPLRRRHQAQIVQHERAQVAGNPARGGNRGIEQSAHGSRILRQIGALAGNLRAKLFDVHLERGQKLPEFIMQFARDACALGFPHPKHGQGQPAQFIICALNLLVRPVALCDVVQNHRE